MDQDLDLALTRCRDLGRRGDITSARSDGLRVRDLAVERKAEEAVASASAMIAWFCLQMGEVESGIEHAYEAKMVWAKRGDPKREASVGAVYAWLLLEAGLTEEAADVAVKTLAQAEDLGDDFILSWALNVLGVIFWSIKQLHRAQVLCERAVRLARSCADRNMLAWWLINEAGVRAEIGYQQTADGNAGAAESLDAALAINAEALALARQIGDVWGVRIALSNSAEYLVALGDIEAATRAILAWEALPEHCGTRTTTQFLYTKGQVLMKQGRLTEALSVCASSLALAQQTRDAASQSQALRYLSEIYEAMGRFDTALSYFKLYHEAQSCFVAEKTQNRVRIAEIHYETDRFKRLAETASRRADQMTLTSMLDPLTGIGNRRRLDQALEAIRAVGERFAIAVLDLDHFKMINDAYSHMVGDAVLRRVASALQSAMHTKDLVFRLGGEEFVVLMANVDAALAVARCTGLNEMLAGTSWHDIDPGLGVTASIGVAAGEGTADPSAILEIADRRLYLAKAAGRNRVVGAEPEAVEGARPAAVVLADVVVRPRRKIRPAMRVGSMA